MADLMLSTEADERLVAKAALDAAEEHLRSLCASHASTFVSVERRGAKLEALLRELQVSISTVVDTNVAPSQEILAEDTLGKLSENHRLRRRTLLQHSSLLELLELPSLMDACVRSNLYQEALSIAGFANSLERRQGTNAVINKVVQQIRTRQSDLKRHLINRLKLQVTMPECLEIVTSLRRLNSIVSESTSDTLNPELKLQLDFLEARDAWLDARAGDSFFDTIEQYRARVFEIATQFNAIFRASGESTPLLGMWTTRRIHSFLSLLKNHQFGDSASLRDAWEASVFFSNSMGRLGADFTPLLGCVFEDKMKVLVTSYWTEGLITLSETLSICRDAGVASPLISTSMVSSQSMEEEGQPPRILLTLPPLGRLVNAVLEGLNELRRCLFVGLFGILRERLDEFLLEAREMLEHHERVVRAPGLRGEAAQLREVASLMLERMDQVVEPYLRGALELALGNTVKAKSFLEAAQENVNVPEERDAFEGDEAKEEKGETLSHVVAGDETETVDPKAGNDVPDTVPPVTDDSVVAEDETETVDPKAGNDVPDTVPPVTDDSVGNEEADMVEHGEGWDEDEYE